MYAHCLAVRTRSNGVVDGAVDDAPAPFLPPGFAVAVAALARDLLAMVCARTSPTMPRPAQVTAALRMTGPWPGAAEEEEEEPGADADENDTEPEPDLEVNRVAPRLPGPPPMGNLPPAARTTPEMPLIVQSERLAWWVVASPGSKKPETRSSELSPCHGANNRRNGREPGHLKAR